MPLIDLTYPQDTFDDQSRSELVERLTSTLLRLEGAPDNASTRVMSRCFVHELPAEHMYVAGQRYPEPTYRIVCTVPKGTLLHGPLGAFSRRELVKEMTQAILDAEGTEYSDQDAGRIFCLIQEINDGFWGGMGEIFTMTDIVNFGAEEPATDVARRAKAALEQAAVELAKVSLE